MSRLYVEKKWCCSISLLFLHSLFVYAYVEIFKIKTSLSHVLVMRRSSTIHKESQTGQSAFVR